MALNIDKPSTKETNIDFLIIALVVLIGIIGCIPLYQKYKTAIQTRINRVLNQNEHVVILSTYGPSVTGSPFYEAYVDKAMKFILDPTNKVNELIIVGGYTVDPNTSQSQAALNYIKEKYTAFNTAGIPVTLDECGITTWQNIKNTKKLMEKEGIKPLKITIFAEESREKKVAFFANNTFHWDASAIMDKRKILMEVDPLILASKEAQLLAYNQPDKVEWARFTYVKDTYLIDKNIRIITVPSGLSQQFADDEHTKIFQEIKEYYDPTYGNKAIKERLDEWAKTAGFNTVENLVKKGCIEYKQFLTK